MAPTMSSHHHVDDTQVFIAAAVPMDRKRPLLDGDR
jgi:hypothetical protein